MDLADASFQMALHAAVARPCMWLHKLYLPLMCRTSLGTAVTAHVCSSDWLGMLSLPVPCSWLRRRPASLRCRTTSSS
jgi:hypothetical protein